MSYVVAVRRKASDVLPVVLFAIALSVLAAVMLGCGPIHPPVKPPSHNPFVQSDESLNSIDKHLTALVIVAILVISASVAVFFILPTAHSIAFAGAAGGGSLLGVSMFLKLALPFLPWIAGIVALGGIGFLGYKGYAYFKKPKPPAA